MKVNKVKKVPKLSKGTPYNKQFVKKILNGEQAIRAGKGVRINIDELANFWK